uniref:Myozenin 1b n=1 Tax=Cyprinus carpio TaxID=7962 RepID=A0A8C1IAG2_CYPCA
NSQSSLTNTHSHTHTAEDAEAAELDLGTKIKAPKDVMLEELSLMKNKGSKMFKMRQQRVEKFIVSDENLVSKRGMIKAKALIGNIGLYMERFLFFCSSIAEEVNAEAEKEKRRREYVRTYVSPWERAMKDDEELKETMKWKITALPFGGFEKASRLVTFEQPEIKDEEPQPVSVFQYNICCRPSFNRTPIGWTCNEEHSHIHMELDNIPFDGETDDL